MALDLGIAGRSALVCGSGSGLGLACATSLAQVGVRVTLNGRTREKLEAAADLIAADSVTRPAIAVSDVATDDGRAALLAEADAIDILVNIGGGPRRGTSAISPKTSGRMPSAPTRCRRSS